jgi:hypothetical protein
MRRMLIVSIALVVMFSAVAAGAATWRVSQDGTGDAFTIQAGIDLAGNGDVVIVAPGTYSGTGNYNVTFNGKNITVMSQAGPFDTVIDCQTLGQAFQFTGGESYDATLEGFTIKNGNGSFGGAIYCDGASPTIRYNLFCDNLAWNSGGAIDIRNGSPTLYNNTFHGNGAPSGGAVMFGPGSNAQFWQNLVCASTSGGAFACTGAGGGTFVACNDIYANVGGSVVCVGSGNNNFSMDPLFCGVPGSDNYFLQQTSPCTANFSPCAAPVGAMGVACTTTATESVTWGQIKSMYR